MLSDRNHQVLTFLWLLLFVTCVWVCVFRREFHFTTGFRKLRTGGTVWECQGWLIKRPHERRREWLTEGGEGEHGVRTAGQGDRGEGNERSWTIRLLMRPFLVAYVGHGMNKQTFTTLDWWFTHTELGCVVYVPHFAIYTQFSHITLKQAYTHKDRATMSCIHCFFPFISLIYGCGPSVPSFKIYWLTHTHKIWPCVWFIFLHTPSFLHTHTLCLTLRLACLFNSGATRKPSAVVFLTDQKFQICCNEMERCATEETQLLG